MLESLKFFMLLIAEKENHAVNSETHLCKEKTLFFEMIQLLKEFFNIFKDV